MKVPGGLLFLFFLTAMTGCTYNRAPEPYSGPSAYGGQVISSAPYTSAPLSSSVPVYSAPGGTNASPNAAAGAPGTDIAVVSQVQRSLQTSELAEIAPNINVSAQNGTVTLTGFVSSERDRQLAGSLARTAGGVLNVNNEIQVVGSATGRTLQPIPASPSDSAVAGNIFNLQVQGLDETDRAVAGRVLDGLRANPSLMRAFPSVNISVANGKVALDGQVQTQQQRQAIESVVNQAAGVANVEDHLHVMSTVPPTSP